MPLCPQVSSRELLRSQLLEELATSPPHDNPAYFLARLLDEKAFFAVGGYLLSLCIELYGGFHDAVSMQISAEEARLPVEDVLSKVASLTAFGKKMILDLYASFLRKKCKRKNQVAL